VPAADAHAHVDPDRGGSTLPDGPLGLGDIDRVLDESSAVQGPSPAQIRAWRDDLMLAREALALATTVLAADSGILRYCLDVPPRDAQAVVDQLPRVLTTRPRAAEPSELEAAGAEAEVFERAAPLLAAHEEMAAVDLSSAEDVGRVLGVVVGTLRALATRQDEVESRLEEIRSVILRHYKEGLLPRLD
jgi:hypothetical protein